MIINNLVHVDSRYQPSGPDSPAASTLPPSASTTASNNTTIAASSKADHHSNNNYSISSTSAAPSTSAPNSRLIAPVNGSSPNSGSTSTATTSITHTAPTPILSSEAYPHKDPAGIPIPQSFQDLVELIRCEMGVYGLAHPSINVSRLQAIMANYKSDPEEWKQFAFFDSNRYTRNLVDDGNGEYNLLLLCWGPGMASPVHDHAGSHCILKVMGGELAETLYKWPDTSAQSTLKYRHGEHHGLEKSREMSLHEDEASYMHDRLGLHRVSNPSSEVPAVSLHLYSPPIEMCTTFCETTGNSRASGKCVFFSVRGNKNGPTRCSAGLS
eukprot:Partr_v1_DN27877_c0_g1_i1_m23374 putative cysteine dioxygenase